MGNGFSFGDYIHKRTSSMEKVRIIRGATHGSGRLSPTKRLPKIIRYDPKRTLAALVIYMLS